MTLTIIFGAIILIGIALCVWDNYVDYCSCGSCLGVIVIILFAIALGINLFTWIPSEKNSEIRYEQLLQEKTAIEAMLSTDKNIDRFTLNDRVIKYNNTVVKIRTNSKRPVYKEYYSQNINWDALGLIEWK